MTVNVNAAVKFEGVHYAAGLNALAADLEQRMVDAGVAKYPDPLAFRSRKLKPGDNTLHYKPVDAGQAAIVPGGLGGNFGCSFADNVAVTFEAPAALRKDKRISGSADPVFSVVNVGGDLYDLLGSKA